MNECGTPISIVDKLERVTERCQASFVSMPGTGPNTLLEGLSGYDSLPISTIDDREQGPDRKKKHGCEKVHGAAFVGRLFVCELKISIALFVRPKLDGSSLCKSVGSHWNPMQSNPFWFEERYLVSTSI